MMRIFIKNKNNGKLFADTIDADHGKSCYNPAGVYLLKVRNTRTRCEIYLTLLTYIVSFEHILHLALPFLLLTLDV